jgi:hypothetical protein
MITISDVKETTRYNSQGIVGTLDGSIQLQQSRGRLVVTDPDTSVELTALDRNGFLFNDGIDRRILLGRHAVEGVGFWLSPDGEDVIDLLDE